MARYTLISRGRVVVGAGGFVGQALSRALFAGQNPRRIAGRLENGGYCRFILRGARTVYYVAGQKQNLRYHLAEPFRFVLGNVRPFLTFLEALAQSQTRKFIYLSSAIVEYADPVSESDGYVLGKYLNEQVLSAFRRQFPKIDVKLVRAAPVYGPGDNFDSQAANFIPATIRKVSRAKGQVRVWGSGKRRLQLVYIDDLVRNLIAAETAKGQFFAFGNRQSSSVNDIVRQIIKLSGKTLGIENMARSPDKPTKLAIFKNLTKPQMTLKSGLKATLDYYLRK